MRYKINKSNYRSFDKLSENRLERRSYFIPFSDATEMNKTDWFSERKKSGAVTLLSGLWDFIYYKRASLLPNDFDTHDACFEKVEVPSTWQKTGYDTVNYLNSRYAFACRPPKTPKNCPVGLYRKVFDLNKKPQSKYLITFLGVCSCLDLYINGRYIGYSEGSHNTAEFDLTDYLKNGENELVAVVYKWSTGSYLECQDMFRENGIFRDVYLTELPLAYFFDFKFEAKKAGSGYNAKVYADIRGEKGAEWKAELLLDGVSIVSEDAAYDKEIDFGCLSVNEWNAEIPICYDLVLTLFYNGKAVEYIRHKVGFCTIELDGCRYLFNGKKIKLKGVNHHDTHPVKGYAMSAEDLKKDVELMKAYNVNCVRTSHYPPDPLFVTMCDVYGIYLIDEADMETHGCPDPKKIGDNPKWEPRFKDRMSALYERDKNHPCIAMWSMGNECTGIRNFDISYNYFKSKTSIPVHYEPACRTERVRYDILAHFYTSPDDMRALARGEWKGEKNYNAPFFLCEYAHSMGVGPGALDEYWDIIYSDDRFLGGCIWEWADHAHYSETAKYKYTYGGDNADKKHDGNFCCDGLFFPDRTPSPSALCMKNIYSPIRTKKRDGKLYITNTNRFLSSANIQISFYMLKNGEKQQEHVLSKIIKPEKTAELPVDFDYNSTDDAFIIFTYTDKTDGSIIAREQVTLNTSLPKISDVPGTVKWNSQGEKFFLKSDKREIRLDANGKICLMTDRNGRRILSEDTDGFNIRLSQAAIDNHKHMLNTVKLLGLDRLKAGKAVYSYSSDFKRISVKFPLTADKRKRFNAQLQYTAVTNSRIRVTCTITSLIKKAVDMPQIGLTLQLNEAYKNVKYYGMGDEECYSDFSKQSVMGIYETTASDMYVPYIKPQESGNRCGVRFTEITDDNKTGLRITAVEAPLNFKAVNIDSQALQNAGHIEDVKQINSTVLHLNGFMRGIGSASCGPDTAEEFKIILKYKESYSYTFDLEII